MTLAISGDVFTGLTQASATVAAVIVGYGLSWLAERRSWEHRKVEQVRDKQLAILIDSVVNFEEILSLLTTFGKILEELANLLQQSESPGSRAALTAVKFRGNALLEQWREKTRTARRHAAALRLLGVAQARSELLQSCIDSLNDFDNIFSSSFSREAVVDLEHFEARNKLLRDVVERLMTLEPQSLYE